MNDPNRAKKIDAFWKRLDAQSDQGQRVEATSESGKLNSAVRDDAATINQAVVDFVKSYVFNKQAFVSQVSHTPIDALTPVFLRGALQRMLKTDLTSFLASKFPHGVGANAAAFFTPTFNVPARTVSGVRKKKNKKKP